MEKKTAKEHLWCLPFPLHDALHDISISYVCLMPHHSPLQLLRQVSQSQTDPKCLLWGEFVPYLSTGAHCRSIHTPVSQARKHPSNGQETLQWSVQLLWGLRVYREKSLSTFKVTTAVLREEKQKTKQIKQNKKTFLLSLDVYVALRLSSQLRVPQGSPRSGPAPADQRWLSSSAGTHRSWHRAPDSQSQLTSSSIHLTRNMATKVRKL